MMDTMKESFGAPQEIPDIRIPNQIDTTDTPTDFKLSPIPDEKIPSKESANKIRGKFEDAYASVVSDKKLERLAVEAIANPDVHARVNVFAKINNIITERCISLSDGEIDLIVESFKKNIVAHADTYDVPHPVRIAIKQGRLNSDTFRDSFSSQGIKSVIQFARARKLLHQATEGAIPALYFQDYFDAKHKIDLIEVEEHPDGTVLQLIQVKSRPYTEGEIDGIADSHYKWIHSFAVPVSAYEHSFDEEPEDSEKYKEFFAEADRLEEIVLELVTSEPPLTTKQFIERIGLSGKPSAEKIWLLKEYIPLFEQMFTEHKDELGLEQSVCDAVDRVFSDVHREIDKIMTAKTELKGIKEVHSLCTVGERIVSDRVVFTGEGHDRKAIKISHPKQTN